MNSAALYVRLSLFVWKILKKLPGVLKNRYEGHASLNEVKILIVYGPFVIVEEVVSVSA